MAIKRHMHRVIVFSRAPGVRPQEKQQLHCIRTEQLLYWLTIHSCSNTQRWISERQPTAYIQVDCGSQDSGSQSSGRTTIVWHTHKAIAVQVSQLQSSKYTKVDFRTTIKRHTHRIIVLTRPLSVSPQEEQHLHSIRTKQLLYGLPSELTKFCR